MLNSKYLRGLCGIGVATIYLSAAAPAHAALTLTLSEPGFAPVGFTDITNSGVVSFLGTYGDFQTNFIAGLSNKLNVPASSSASLQIQSLNVKNLSNAGTTKTLTVVLTDDGYTIPGVAGSPVQLDSSFGGTITGTNAGDSVTFQSYVISPAVTTGLQSYISPVTNPGTTSFSSNVVPVGFIQPASYTLSNTTTIALSAAGDSTNLSGTTNVTVVPEPASFATAAAGVGMVVGRRRRA